MKYKKFTSTGFVFFYDSASKLFPDYYKYLKYRKDSNLCSKRIVNVENKYSYKFVFDLNEIKNNRYQFAKSIDMFFGKLYRFNEDMDFEDVIDTFT